MVTYNGNRDIYVDVAGMRSREVRDVLSNIVDVLRLAGAALLTLNQISVMVENSIAD